MNPSMLVDLFQKRNINITSQMLSQFETYYKILIDYNTKVNLTSIINKEDVYLKHFYDSLSLLLEYDLKEGATLVDVGAGAGFPSVPLKIVRPDLSITIVDSLGKRIEFLNYLFESLKLKGIKAVNYRAEDYAKDHRESFDYVTARAVARLNILSELCVPLVKVHVEFIAMKSLNVDEELSEAKNAIEILGCQLKNKFEFDLPQDGGRRTILIYKKTIKTPNKYPRNYGQIKKKPL